MNNHLTVLSFGGGQDSTAILYKIIYDPEFKAQYVKGDLIVVMAETGNEKKATYEHVKEIQETCVNHDINFVHLDFEYTPKSWKLGLIPFYQAGNRIGSKAFPKTCTDNLKIKPIYSFLDEWIAYKYTGGDWGRKKAIKQFVHEGGKIDVLLGIAHGEETRASTNEESPLVWMRNCINKIYPLIDLEMDRQACQDYIKEVGHKVPPPSACILCPFMNDIEMLALYRFDRWWWDKWVELEANKIEANKHMGEKNLGVCGKKLLPEKIKEIIAKHGHMTDDELHEYTMSHGHCVKSKY